MQCYRRSMRISYAEHVTNDEVLQRVGQGRALMGQVKSRKLEYFGHISRHNSLKKDIMLGFMPGTKRQGGQKRQWIGNVTQWTGKGLVDIVRLAENRVISAIRIWHRLRSFTGHGTIAMVQAKGDAAAPLPALNPPLSMSSFMMGTLAYY